MVYMVKKYKFKKKEKGETDRAREEIKGLEDLPFVGGLFKGLGKFVDLVEKVEEVGEEIKKRGEVKGKEGVRGIYGFSIRTGIGERAKIQTFGNIRETKKGVRVEETREPIVDTFNEKDHMLIIAELPGIDEKSIKLDLKKNILFLEAGNHDRKYKKEILLPAEVDFASKEMHFKNGILEIKLEKSHSSKGNVHQRRRRGKRKKKRG